MRKQGVHSNRSQGGRNCIHVAAAEGNVEAMKIIYTVEGVLDLELPTKVRTGQGTELATGGTLPGFLRRPGTQPCTGLLPMGS